MLLPALIMLNGASLHTVVPCLSYAAHRFVLAESSIMLHFPLVPSFTLPIDAIHSLVEQVLVASLERDDRRWAQGLPLHEVEPVRLQNLDSLERGRLDDLERDEAGRIVFVDKLALDAVQRGRVTCPQVGHQSLLRLLDGVLVMDEDGVVVILRLFDVAGDV